MSRWGQASRRALFAALALAAPVVLVGSAASADRELVPAARLAAYSPVTPGTSCVPDDVAGVVNGIAWAEIERLGEAGLPVCDVAWSFVADRAEWWWWGVADVDREAGEAPHVWIVEDVAAYADEGEDAVDGDLLEQHVRTTVRHELGHALGALLRIDVETIDDMVTVDLEREEPGVLAGPEAFAEAIAVALTPADETRTWFYDEDARGERARGRAGARRVRDRLAAPTTERPRPVLGVLTGDVGRVSAMR
ncbi:hypothetical protein [Cellulosimicrobium cellulans]|uniref:hypothetical protein n=1 Tax=Cellulosimicrobium cellulans TaxID=1710 RepID=UPI0024074B4A|nr:hypothetical protein [Cellulosimicrobium cellulans]MDF9878635.1 hypothetical protein [Cellulosimicrobium cellulans]